jgi:hypothetical protein
MGCNHLLTVSERSVIQVPSQQSTVVYSSRNNRRESWENCAFGLRILHHIALFILFAGAITMAVLGGLCYFGGIDPSNGAGYCVNLGRQGGLGLFIAGVVLFGLLLIYSIIFCACMCARDRY